MNFIIKEKEGDDIYFQLLKLDLYFLVLKNIDLIFYLNKIYKIEKNIIITKQFEEKEYLFHFGNKALIYNDKKSEISKENKLKIKKIKGNKYLGKNKLKQDTNVLQGIKQYKVYQIILPTKKGNLLF